MHCPKCGANNIDTARLCWRCSTELTMARHDPAVVIQPQPARTHLAYAGFWRRVGAVLIDTIPLAIMTWIIGSATDTPSMFWWDVDDVSDVRGFVLGALITWLYFALSESSRTQATLGKLIVGLYVTDEDGCRINFARATGRHFGKYISGVLLGIGFLMAGFSAKKQGLHDMLAKTLVLRHS